MQLIDVFMYYLFVYLFRKLYTGDPVTGPLRPPVDQNKLFQPGPITISIREAFASPHHFHHLFSNFYNNQYQYTE